MLRTYHLLFRSYDLYIFFNKIGIEQMLPLVNTV